MALFQADYIYHDGTLRKNWYLEVDERGKISYLGSEGGDAIKLSGICLPGLVNGHSHAFQVLLRGWGDNPKNFHDWVSSVLYPLASQLTKEEISTATQVAYAQMLRNGITTVGEFHYLHNLREGETADGPDTLSETVINAALSTGIRQRFLYTGYDRKRRDEQERFIRTPDQVVSSLNQLYDKFKSTELIHIGASPHSLHGASMEMIKAMVTWATDTDEILHIHLSEQQSDIDFALELYGKRPVQVLADEGLLSDNVVFVHAIWLDDDEVSVMAEHGVSHVYNPLTNMALGDGTAPLTKYLKAGIVSSVGTDANISLDLLGEARAAEWLQRLESLEMGSTQQALPDSDAGKVLFDMATKHGATTMKLPIGELKVGNYADFMVIDPFDLSLRPNQYLIDQLVSSVSIRDVLKSVYVGGTKVFDEVEGFLLFDESELVSKFQSITYGE
ncbi:MAG: amidohydrolase family protein [Candidatus Kariarchaeaceae archaeon]|jgi:formiminoglutamate deiminase